MYTFDRKTELMSHASMKSTVSSSSNRGHEISVSCSERALSSAVLLVLLLGPDLNIDLNRQPGVFLCPTVQ